MNSEVLTNVRQQDLESTLAKRLTQMSSFLFQIAEKELGRKLGIDQNQLWSAEQANSVSGLRVIARKAIYKVPRANRSVKLLPFNHIYKYI